MKVLITAPFCWPFVRRGNERFIHDCSHYLVHCGHEVTVLSTKPGPEDVVSDGPVKVIRKRQISNALFRRLGLSLERSFGLSVARFLSKNQFDVVFCFHFWDAWGVRIVNLFSRQPYVLYFPGIPWGKYFRRRPLDNLVLRSAFKHAAAVVVASRFALHHLKTDFRRQGLRIPVPCDVKKFPLSIGRDLERPRILCAGSFSEPRKGARVLAAAFEIVKRTVPAARLQYSGHMPEDMRQSLLGVLPTALHGDVEFLGVGSPEDLPRLYGEAALTVLPSVWETYGMVLTESLACGTPVVGSRHGGITDIVEEGIGFLFDPGDTVSEATNASGLGDAILKTLGLYRDPELAVRCRQRAERLSWHVLGPQLEQVVARAAGIQPAAARG